MDIHRKQGAHRPPRLCHSVGRHRYLVSDKLSLGSGPLKSTIAASKWQRYRRKMAAAGSYSACKGILFRDRSHFGVRRICPILSIAALAKLDLEPLSLRFAALH
jgi:hypothetical protein